MTLIAQVYCTQADIERRYSAATVTEWTDHDGDGTPDTGVLDDAINQAAQEIEVYGLQWYSQAGLAASNLINRWATTIAAFFASISRGNPPPESLHVECERILGMLERVAGGTIRLPGVAFRSDLRPTMSNLRVDRRYTQAKVRVRQEISTDSPTTLAQHLDHNRPNYY